MPIATTAPGQPGIRHLKDDLFAVANDHGIEKISDRLRVAGAGTAGHDEGMGFVPVILSEGNPSQGQDAQHAGIIHFVE